MRTRFDMNNRVKKIIMAALAVCISGAPGVSPRHGIRPPLLFSAERNFKKEINGIIDGILDADSAGSRQELIKTLRTYPPDLVGACWREVLDRAWRASRIAHVIDVMSEFNDKSFVLPVANHLISPHSPVRKSAALALKKIGDDRLFPVILKMAASSVPVHRIYFIEAMNYLYDQRFYIFLANMLRDDNKSIRIYIINCFRENRILESLGLIRNVALYDKNDEVRIVAIEALGILRDGNSVNIFHVTLNDRSREIRCESAKSIYAINSAVSINPVSSRLLVEDDNEIKDLLIETLLGLKRTGDTRGLERILTGDASAVLRIKSACVLGFSANMSSQTALQQALKDQDYRVRAEACNSLGYFRNRQALAGLMEVLGRDEPAYVKSSALYAIRRINDKSSLIGLFDLYCRETDPVFREMLHDAIREYIKKFI